VENLFHRWFLAKPRRGVGVPVRVGNDVTPYIDYDRYYAAAGEALSAAGPRSVVLLAGWALGRDTPVSVAGRSVRIDDQLAAVGSRGGKVRVLLSGHLGHPNQDAVTWLNGKPGCMAIVDDRVRIAGCFHQKALVVIDRQVVAFVGGMDFGGDRLADLSSPDPAKRRGPWHDVQVRISGPAAAEVYETLAQRWESWPANSGNPLPRVPAGGGARGAKRAVQVVRTYGNPRSGVPLPTLQKKNLALDLRPGIRPFLGQRPNEFSFAPTGESSIHDLLVQAIRATERHIYVEDQYFIASAAIGGDDELLRALADTIAKPTFTQLIVLTCGVGTIQGELYQVNRRRKALWSRIASKYPDRVSVWAYKGGQDRSFWVHSKMWLFDDTFAVIGSANFNRRGLSHDGELGVGVLDLEKKGWVRELRKQLWLKHLPTDHHKVTAEHVHDFETGRRHWVDTKDTLLARLDLQVGDPFQPDQFLVCNDRPVAERVKPFRAVACQPGVLGVPLSDFESQWNLVLDPDGT